MILKWLMAALVVLILFFVVGFKVSFDSGIQPGYFEKQEAPAYGVGGGTGLGVDLDKEAEEYYKDLYKTLEE